MSLELDSDIESREVRPLPECAQPFYFFHSLFRIMRSDVHYLLNQLGNSFTGSRGSQILQDEKDKSAVPFLSMRPVRKWGVTPG